MTDWTGPPTTRIRAYLDARATTGATVDHLGSIDTCDGHELTETDLGVLLRMIDLLSNLSIPRPMHVDQERLIAWAHDRVLGTTFRAPTP